MDIQSQRSLQELAAAFDAQLAVAAQQVADLRARAPGAIIARPARIPDGMVKTRQQHINKMKAKNGYDLGVGRYFNTVAEAKAYRKEHGIVEMNPDEFRKEVGDAPSEVSEPPHTRFGNKVFEVGPYANIQGFNPNNFFGSIGRQPFFPTFQDGKK